MGTRTIKTRIELDGEKDFKAGLEASYQTVSKLYREMQIASATFDDNASAMDKNTQKSKLLRSEIDAQKALVQSLAERLKYAQQAYGENSSTADEYASKLNKAMKALDGMEKNLASTEKAMDDLGDESVSASNDLDQTAKSVDDVGEASQNAETKARRLSDGFTVMKGVLSNLITDALRKGAEAIKSFATESVDLGSDLQEVDMRLTHADADRRELRYIDVVERLDTQISIDPTAALVNNSFALAIPDEEWSLKPISKGHFLYIDGTEWGGPVEVVDHSTRSKIVTLSGPTWRGMLMRKVIEPPVGQAYYSASGEANSVLAALLAGVMNDLFQVDASDTGISIAAQWRYAELHAALEKALEAAGLTLSISYSAATRKVMVSARPVADSSATIDLSQDYGIDMRSTQGRIDGFNHIIALGAGELLERDVMHLYRLPDGIVTITPPAWAGTLNDRVTIYDYNNPESLEDLGNGATARLLEYMPKDSVQLDPSEANLDLPLGDIVGARDRLTGLAAKARIQEKILIMSASGIQINTRVG